MSTNPHEFGDPNRQGQYPPPPQWNSSQPEDNPAPAHYPPASQYPYPPASYPPPLTADHPYPHPPPPPSQYPPTSHMATIHPHVQGTQDPYRLPPPPGAYRPQDVYAQPAPPPQPQVVYQAAAPRQRTAIACRYCRRRKIRCSGFESSQDGRCSNCIRFNQECMFTPVSSQAQAFVPAHAAYPHLRNPQNGRAGPPVMLYGAHGQPLPPQQQPQPPADSTLPPPQGMYQHPYGTAPPPLASAVPADHRPAGRRGSGSGFEYPDPTNLAPVTPATSAPAYQAHAAPSPYYPPPPQHDRRPSPQSAYPYDSRHSSSPHSSPYPPLHTAPTAMTPPPTSTPGGSVSSSRGGLNVRDMLNPGDSQGRSSTDSDMLNALNRRGLNQ
ncbi:hypothetical protein ALT_1138 [Aspergillus lentulus]|uniref:Zn(2)-C6 fungal-type domain-containing protein n=1 Tax=Aspergillus lentulus TaxID=293939 RepID=A0AAN4PCB8_ASPLE|nr:hypothetical protein CNMCM6069_001001 [Aspergillus lentulus]KAF4163485.1 hypothetical protein CNMCM6936_000669 [Aspergillus lentulus]KAF4173107.1 hypothetical protein CNMCM8060_000593 [Aspergillus lentulus]KAF4184027.1 hypothetical protein CNMCM7927_008411 [Aspergillus lentulus]KAF4191800.1 hypothetical protein CNMCM8694_001339 [Aspergillus lentulus]